MFFNKLIKIKRLIMKLKRWFWSQGVKGSIFGKVSSAVVCIEGLINLLGRQSGLGARSFAKKISLGESTQSQSRWRVISGGRDHSLMMANFTYHTLNNFTNSKTYIFSLCEWDYKGSIIVMVTQRSRRCQIFFLDRCPHRTFHSNRSNLSSSFKKHTVNKKLGK